MTEISFKLIRKENPDLDFDKLEAISSISLNKCGIAEIDNLELFNHLKELHLSHNAIEKIENLFFFNQLEFLDLSFNRISSDGLAASLRSIPNNLKAINLSGNPCLADDDVLLKLQDTYPELGIIIDELDDVEEEEEEEGEGEEEEEEEAEEEHEYVTFQDVVPYDGSRLNSDVVLKAIVERKSKLQSYSPFNLDAAVTELGLEYDTAVEKTDTQRASRHERIRVQQLSTETGALSDSIAARSRVLVSSSREESVRSVTKFDEMMARLKTTATTTMDAIKSDREKAEAEAEAEAKQEEKVAEKENAGAHGAGEKGQVQGGDSYGAESKTQDPVLPDCK